MSVAINETNFPNRDFRNYVSQYWDLDGDGTLSDEEIAAVTSFYCRPNQYHSWSFNVKGLEFFTNLEVIDTSGPSYRGVDFSVFTKLKTVNITDPYSTFYSLNFRACSSLTSVTLLLQYISSLYFGANIKTVSVTQYSGHTVYPEAVFDFNDAVSIQSVRFVSFGGINDPYGEENKVTIIGLSNKGSLTNIEIKNCKCFLSLDCSNNVNLTDFSCTDCNIFRHLNISGCRKLERFTCNNTDLRPSLDLREMPDLEYVDVTRTNLSSLLLGDKPVLSVLRCFTTSDNIAISSLDLNGCPLIKNKLFVQQNRTVDNIIYQFFGYVENPPEQNPFNQIVVYDYRTNIVPISVSVVEGDEIPYASLVEPIWNHLSLYDESTMHAVDMLSKVEYSSNGKKYIFEDISKVYSADETWVEDPDDPGVLVLNPNINWTSVILARSLAFELTVLQRPIISAQPQSVSVANGYEAVFSVTAIAPYGEELTYQWEKSIDGETWSTIQSNAASAVYSVPVSTVDDGCRYRCIVSSPVASITSDAATVSVVLANFQWQVSDDNGSTWTDISQNGDSGSYFFVASKSDSGKQYRCIATNVAGSDISYPATLTVYDLPAIVSRSVIQECIAENTEVLLSVTASGDELHYRWEESVNLGAWTSIDGATSSAYSFTASRADTGKRYRCYVYNDVGNVTCDIYDDPANVENGPTSITVVYEPVVSPEESSSVVRTGNRASFSISAEGGRLTYKWQASSDNGSTWTDIPNATEDTYAFAATKSDSGKQYRCQVTNIAGTTHSVAITLTVLDPPVINSELSIPDVGDGAEVLLQSNASGDELEYKWQISANGIDWTDIAENGTGETYSFTASVSQNHTYYRYQVFNRFGEETSNAAQLFVITSPNITAQPESQVVTVQSQVSFSVGTEGEHLSHKWQLSSDNGSIWTDIPNATEDTYAFAATKSDSGNQYHCVVTNVAGTATSNAATLTVQDPVAITTDPTIADYVANESEVTLSVTATGDPVHYKWQESANGSVWTDINDSDSASYTFTVSSAIADHQYRCYVYNDVSNTTSDAITVHVVYEPGFRSYSADDETATIDPLTVKVRTGALARFSVDAYGGGLSYQWESKAGSGSSWTSIQDAIENTYAFAAARSDSGRQYRCTVTNAAGSVTSAAAALTVVDPVQVAEQPHLDDYIPDGSETALSVTVSGDSPHYQWQESANGSVWTNIVGADSDTYTFLASSAISEHFYRCHVWNDVSEINSDEVIILISYPPRILVPPSDTKVKAGSSATFIVSASGGGLRYQWQSSIDNGAHWSAIADATFPTYSFTAAKSDSRTKYRCEVTNSYDTVVSDAAMLTVIEPVAITAQPSLPEFVVNNTEVTVFVAVSGDGVSYQWQQSANGKSWTPIDGEESYQYTFLVSSDIADRQYRCYVYNDVSNATSDAVTVHVAYKPVIATTLEPLVVSTGTTVRYRISASGGGLNYQWQYSINNGNNWIDIQEANNDIYFFQASKMESGRQYRCKVSNVVDIAVSNASALSVYDPVTIIEQPSLPELVANGTEIALSVSATGDNLLYQWKRLLIGENEWEDLSSATGASYSFIASKGLAGARYQCLIQNQVSRVTSNTVTLNVYFKPEILNVTGPETAVQSGQAVSYSCIAVGGDLHYQWKVSTDNGASWTEAPGSNDAETYSFIVSSSQNGYRYLCAVTNDLGTTESEILFLVVKSPPVIVSNPADAEASIGSVVTFRVSATGADLQYQWQASSDYGAGWIDISGETASVYSFAASVEKNGNQYRCRVYNDVAFVFSRTASLTILSEPAITEQPKSIETEYGSNVVFAVTATGGNLVYQWQYRVNSSTSWANVDKNGNSSVYSFIAVSTYNGYQYRCQIHNSIGSILSDSVSLTVSEGSYDEPSEEWQAHAGKYLPSQMAAMIRALPVAAYSHLDTILFGEHTSNSLANAATNPGTTDPQNYEAIAKAINELKQELGMLP